MNLQCQRRQAIAFALVVAAASESRHEGRSTAACSPGRRSADLAYPCAATAIRPSSIAASISVRARGRASSANNPRATAKRAEAWRRRSPVSWRNAKACSRAGRPSSGRSASTKNVPSAPSVTATWSGRRQRSKAWRARANAATASAGSAVAVAASARARPELGNATRHASLLVGNASGSGLQERQRTRKGAPACLDLAGATLRVAQRVEGDRGLTRCAHSFLETEGIVKEAEGPACVHQAP